MANYCITKYWVEGDKAVLDKLAALIGDGTNVTKILPEMGMSFSQLSFEEEGCPYWYGAKRKDGVLSFTEEAKWEQSQCLWNLQKGEGSGIADIRYYSFVAESEYFTTNDAEGKYFPYRITVFCDVIPEGEPPYFYCVSEDNTLLFKTKEEMLASFGKGRDWKARTEDELRCVAEKNGYMLFCSEIQVVPGPTHLGINKMKFDYQRGDEGIIHVTIK